MTSMKIGIITLPLHTNYGGILQAYALQTTLEQMGHQVEILEEPLVYKHASLNRYTRRILKKCVGKRSIINYEGFMRKWQPRVAANINQFINTYIHRRIVNFERLSEGEYDAFVVGSDQVWRPSYNYHIKNAFLGFAENWKNVKRIAYSRFESLLKTVGLLHKNCQDPDLLIRYYKCSKSNFSTIKMQQNETLKILSEYLC